MWHRRQRERESSFVQILTWMAQRNVIRVAFLWYTLLRLHATRDLPKQCTSTYMVAMRLDRSGTVPLFVNHKFHLLVVGHMKMFSYGNLFDRVVRMSCCTSLTYNCIASEYVVCMVYAFLMYLIVLDSKIAKNFSIGKLSVIYRMFVLHQTWFNDVVSTREPRH